ncbi:MAG: 4-hydroxy-3-methylbut-2-enyl diphosphate reductase [Filifactoraceae bacterium]
MIIQLADKLGFCYGVERAVNKTEELLREKSGTKICTLGELIHNKRLIDKLNLLGVKTINSIDEIGLLENLIIRSHGESKLVYEKINNKRINYFDCTCPHVKKIHNIVEQESALKKHIIVIGDKNHPEIIGIVGWISGEYTIINSLNDINKLPKNNFDYSCVVQTTFDLNFYEEIKKNLKFSLNSICFYDTICYATKQRQESTEKLAKLADLMIIVGGKNSSNTKKLAQIAEQYCKTILVEGAEELVFEDFKNIHLLGIAAGASTPKFVIDEILEFVLTQNNIKELETMSSEMEKLLMEEEQNYQEVYKGSKVKGIVERIKPDSYYITLNYKTDGVLPKSETDNSEDIKVGDELNLEVVKIDKNTGEIILSKRRLDEFRAWDDLVIGNIINVSVVDKNEKGLITKYKNSIRGFIPLSHIENRFINDGILDNYMGSSFDVEIIDVDQKKRRLILSRKSILAKENAVAKSKLLENLTVGENYKGIIKDIKDYGLFVDLGGLTGLVHVSELSWNRKENIIANYKLEDEITVQILDFDKEKERLSLSVKSMVPNPWDLFLNQYNVADEVEGTVKNIKDYGVFITLADGIDGFVHISNISSTFIKSPQEIVKVGEIVTTKILTIDKDTKKIELTMNLASDEEVVEEEDVTTTI